MLQEILKVAGPALVSVVSAALVWALAKLAALLHAKTNQTTAVHALQVATDFVNTAVQHAQEKLAPDLKAALADGVITSDERAKILADALDLVKQGLPDGVAKVLTDVLGEGLETWLAGKISGAMPATVSPVQVPKNP